MATRVVESAVLPGPVGRVWELLRPFNFAYLKRVREVKVDAANPGVGGVRAVTYADGTVQQLKLTTLSEAKRQIGWDVIGSEPAISVLSVSHQLQLFRVTTDDATFVEWETLFSADASTAVTEDARFKQRENFAALRDALTAAAGAAPKPAAAAADRKDEKAAPAGAAAAAAAAGAGAALKVFEWETPKREMLETAEKTLELAAPLAAAPNGFQKLRLSGHSFSPLAAQAMAPVLAKTSALQVVDISDVIAVRSTPDVVAALTTLTTALAANNKGVTELNVSDNALGLAGVQACKPLLEAAGRAGVAKLQVLKFNNNGLEGDAAEFITKTVLGASGKPTALRHFEIHNNCLTDDGAKGLAPLFAASPLLERIRFTTTRLSDEGGDALVKSLVDCGSRAFVSIELGDNSLGEDAGMLFATKVLADQPRLQHLGMGDTGFGAKALAKAFEALAKTAPNLQVLDLNNLEIDAKLALRVAELIKAKPSLTRVSLEGNDFGDKGAAAIVAAVAEHKGLTELNLNGTALSSKSIAPLFAALKGKAIAKLSLNANRFNAKGVAAIKDAVKAMGLPAKALDSLSDNEDDDEDATDVTDAMAKLSLKK